MTHVPKEFLSNQAQRELKLQLREKERQMYAEPGGHVGDMFRKKPLPEADLRNPCIQMTLKQNGLVLGSMVIELFSEYVPNEIKFLKQSFEGFKVVRLRKDMLIELERDCTAPTPTEETSNLEHSEPYLLTMKRGARKATFRLTEMLVHSMDRSHQVVGRILNGFQSLEIVNTIETNHDEVNQGWKIPAEEIEVRIRETRHPLAAMLAEGDKTQGDLGDTDEERLMLKPKKRPRIEIRPEESGEEEDNSKKILNLKEMLPSVDEDEDESSDTSSVDTRPQD